MTKESAKLCLERANSDSEFAKKLAACKNSEEFIAFVKSEGFDCTPKEYFGPDRPLTDDMLENVAGGNQGGGQGPPTCAHCGKRAGHYPQTNVCAECARLFGAPWKD